jgi:catechol 2,3-dioxygenase-like lactoylglutathione lyase family enzyme
MPNNPPEGSNVQPLTGPLDTIDGIDHVVVSVHDLERTAQTWAEFGFTLAPKGIHSAHIGTANYTIMLADDYIELISVITPTENNISTRDYLVTREGLDRAAFNSRDAGRGIAALRACGIDGTGPLEFSRPVTLADGSRSTARFRTFAWPRTERPGNVRLFACEHLTRESIWQPALTQHANTARRIDHIEVLSADPKAACAYMERLTGLPAMMEPDGALRVETAQDGQLRRGNYVFLDAATLAKRYAGLTLGALPTEGAISISLHVADLTAAKSALGRHAVDLGHGRIAVPPSAANGVILEFRQLS